LCGSKVTAGTRNHLHGWRSAMRVEQTDSSELRNQSHFNRICGSALSRSFRRS
jgi:hypothetical protein